MSTNNTFASTPSSALGNLSSFEPEAILAAMPGEHPRMASALALGREASETGHFDVAELSRIVNELYAEGFPAGSPLAKQPEVPNTASLSHVAIDAVLPNATPPKGVAQAPALSSLSAMPSAASAKPDYANLEALHLQYSQSTLGAFNVEHLLGGVENPYENELKNLFSDTHSSAGISSAGSSAVKPATGA